MKQTAMEEMAKSDEKREEEKHHSSWGIKEMCRNIRRRLDPEASFTSESSYFSYNTNETKL